MTSELSKLKKEINALKKKKERQMQLSSSMQEREQLLNEIRQLELVKQSPSQLQKFGKTFGRGLKIVGKNLWGGVKSASRNLNKNAPEYKEFSRGMVSKQNPNLTPPDIDTMYSSQVRMRVPNMKVRRMKTHKGKKVKKMKMRKVKRGFRVTDRATNPNSWELP